MAKGNKPKSDKPKVESIGSLIKGNLSQRERNLAVKKQMIEEGRHPEPTKESGLSIREQNLANKAKLKADDNQR